MSQKEYGKHNHASTGHGIIEEGWAVWKIDADGFEDLQAVCNTETLADLFIAALNAVADPANRKIVVKYYNYDRALEVPTVTIPDTIKPLVEVELVDSVAVDSLVMTHNGVSIYQTIKDYNSDSVMFADYWYDTQPRGDYEDNDVFDIRDLPLVPDSMKDAYQRLFPGDQTKQKLAHAIDMGLLEQDEEDDDDE